MDEHGSTRRFQMKIVALAVVAAASLLLAGWGLYSRFSHTNEIRAAQQRVWHAVVCTLEQATLKSKKATQAEKQTELRFFDRLLVEDVGAAPCGLLDTRRNQ